MDTWKVAYLIKEYYKENPAGGHCHVVLDDLNIRNGDIEYCIGICTEFNDIRGLMIMRHMLTMSKTQRNKTIKIAKGF